MIHVSPSSKDCNKWLNHDENEQIDKQEQMDERDGDNYQKIT